MNVRERIKQAHTCEVIVMTEAEADAGLYRGCGPALARFNDGNLAELYYPVHDVTCQSTIHTTANDATSQAVKWLERAENNHPTDEIWLVMCSCYELCEPRSISTRDAAALAKMGRVIGEELQNSGTWG
ncbi:MAG: hypothetical protein LBV29_09365 [Azoarcus sp.]|jgi:hypothetical protein|nr:hypothetical protein [Azoarcus sp.]